MNFNDARYIVVGAGFFGSVIAERIAADLGERVLVIEQRPHPGGNSYSDVDAETGIEVHRYGSHIFHTSHRAVWDYISRFAAFNRYRHRVVSLYGGKRYTIPINLGTINSFYGLDLKPAEVHEFLQAEAARDAVREPANLEEKAVSLVGRALYEAFIKGYTAKQWGTDPAELPADIIARLPVRCNHDDAYFDDPWQGIPTCGYGTLFKRILSHSNIDLRLNLDFLDIRDRVPSTCTVVYTGPIDRFFDYRFGRLGWRSASFERQVHNVPDYQGTAVVNYAELETPCLRSHEFKHYHPERDYASLPQTVVFNEYSRATAPGELPYYPINTRRDQEILALYRAEAAKTPNLIFGGRLGAYAYINMDTAIADALHTYTEGIRQS